MMVPIVKVAREASRQIGLPNMSLRLAMKGMQTAHVSKYDVPIQKPSVAVPLRSLMIVYTEY
jgi:hypothetical protein